MANIKPKKIEKFTDRNEEIAYEILSSLDDSYSVIYEPSIGEHSKRTPDFIVLSEEYGLIVLDVKFVKIDNIEKSDERTIYKKNGLKIQNFSKTVQNYAYKVNNQLVKNLKTNINVVHSSGNNQGKLKFPHSNGLLLFISDYEKYMEDDVSQILSLDSSSFIICNDKELAKNKIEDFIKNLNRPFLKGISQTTQQDIIREIYMESNAHSNEFITKLGNYNLPLNQEFQKVLEGDIFQKSKQLKNNVITFTRYAQDSIEYANKNLQFGFENLINKLKELKFELEDEKFTVGVFGYFGNGKSTFLNALLNVNKLPVAEERLTATFTKLIHCDESEEFNDGEMEVLYKDKESIETLFIESLLKLPLSSEKINQYKDYDKTKQNKKLLLDDLKLIRLRDYTGAEKEEIKNSKIIISAILENEIKYGNRDKIKNEDEIYSFITDDQKALFLEEVTYYLDNDLLKNVQIVDTPGYGSTNTLDTYKTHQFVKDTNVVILLTKATTPLEEKEEASFIEEYAALYKETDNIVKADNLFIVANKIDIAEKGNDVVKKQIYNNIESDWEDGFIIDNDKIFTLSSKYHFDKQNDPNISIENYRNVREDDLLNFKNSFSSYLTQNKDRDIIFKSFSQIEDTINKIQSDFQNQVSHINRDINDIKDKKEKFEKNKSSIIGKLNIYKDSIQGVHKILLDSIDNKLDQQKISITNTNTKEDAIKKVAEAYHRFLKSINDGVKEKTAKDFFKKYIESINKKTFDYIDELYSKSLFEKLNTINEEISNYTSELEKEYDVSGLIKELRIVTAPKKEIENIDLSRNFLKKLWDWFADFVLGNEAQKYAEPMVEGWNNEHLRTIVENNLKNSTKQVFTLIQNELESQIASIVNSIGDKLDAVEQQLERRQKDKEEFNIKVDSFDKVFKRIETFKEKIKTQEQELYRNTKG